MPGLEDAGQVEAGVGGLIAARAVADRARNHEGAQAALGLVGVDTKARDDYTGKMAWRKKGEKPG